MSQSTRAKQRRNHLEHLVRRLASRIMLMPTQCGIGLLHAYRYTLSPDHGPLRRLWPYGYCRHSPTCSTYALQKVQSHGLLVGGALALLRVLGCTPFRKPDPEKILEASHGELARTGRAEEQ